MHVSILTTAPSTLNHVRSIGPFGRTRNVENPPHSTTSNYQPALKIANRNKRLMPAHTVHRIPIFPRLGRRVFPLNHFECSSFHVAIIHFINVPSSPFFNFLVLCYVSTCQHVSIVLCYVSPYRAQNTEHRSKNTLSPYPRSHHSNHPLATTSNPKRVCVCFLKKRGTRKGRQDASRKKSLDPTPHDLPPSPLALPQARPGSPPGFLRFPRQPRDSTKPFFPNGKLGPAPKPKVP